MTFFKIDYLINFFILEEQIKKSRKGIRILCFKWGTNGKKLTNLNNNWPCIVTWWTEKGWIWKWLYNTCIYIDKGEIVRGWANLYTLHIKLSLASIAVFAKWGLIF